MCGIAGYLGRAELPAERQQECLQLMGRRGPDAAGWYAHQHGDRRVYLLHRRLSIIDLDPRAGQPFRAGTRVLVFNGELYNYLELKTRLAAAGVAFRTASDTEVLLQQLARHGVAGLAAGEGMWALACYDEADGSLLLSRDRFGEKPLYLYRDGTGLYFGSEVKFIFALLGHRLPVNHDHLYRYLVNGYKALYKRPISFFVGLEELAAGHVLEVGPAGRETRRTYWHFALDEDERMSAAEAAAGVRERLLESVKLRLRADVPLAFCLSGGIDSNSLIAIARRVFDYDVHGFTIVNSDTRYEEQAMVECSVRELGIRHTAIPVQTTEFLPRLRTLVCQHDAPVYTITYYAHWLLMQAVAEHGYKVSLSGTGADELFSGYYDHHLLYLAAVAADPELLAESLRHWERHIKPIVRNPFLQDPRVFIRQPGLRDHIFLDARELATYLVKPWAEPFAETAYAPVLLRNRMLNELFHESVPMILHEDDLNAMYFSIENRSPFLDAQLLAFSLRIPTRLLVQQGAAKAVLRAAMRGIVPDPILDNRRKVGFNAPIRSFLDVTDPQVRAAVLDRSPVFEHVRRDRIEALVDQPTVSEPESKFLFYFLTTKMFLELFAAA